MGAEEKTLPMTDSQKADTLFDQWWSKRGWPLARKAALYPSADLVRGICQIAYYQGRLDESTKHAEQTGEQLSLLVNPPDAP